MSELKPCPFCGSSNTTLDYYEISGPQELGTIVVCNDCGASAKSIVDWNTRPIESENTKLKAKIAELTNGKIDGLEIVMTKQMQKMIDKELKKRFEELKPELATRYEELLNMRNMETDQFNDGFNDARAGKLETDHPHYDLDTDNWRLGYAWGMFEPMKEKLARERQVSDAEINELGAQEAEKRDKK